MKLVSAKIRVVVGAVFVAAGAYSTVIQAQDGDATAGEAKAGLCGGCHGFDGNSEDAAYPRLAGQYADYIVKQVKDFKNGHRANNETMTGMAGMVGSDQDAKDIGAYFAQQKIKGAITKPRNDVVAQGEKIFLEGNAKTGVYGCVNCHGEKGMGKSASVSTFPVIGGQHRDYLVKQLKEFRDGGRENDPAGMMTAVADKLTDNEIEAVAEYLANQL
ncbi:c-type cytochrome [Pseudomonadota bacterium]